MLGTGVHIICSYQWIIKGDFGIRGTGYSMLACEGTIFLTIHAYSLWNDEIRQMCSLPNIASFKNIPKYLKVALPQMVIVWISVLVWEINLIVAGVLGKFALAAQTILMTVYDFN